VCRRRSALALLALAVACSVGCASFVLDLAIEPKHREEESIALTDDQLAAVLKVVGDVAERFEFVVDRRLEDPAGLRQYTAGADEWDYEIVMLYERAVDEATGYSRVEIEVRRAKASGAISVHILDRHGRSYEKFSNDVATALIDGISSALPSHAVGISRR
jgi:hypothetical protein